MSAIRYPYVIGSPALGPAASKPMLPIQLASASHSLSADGLLDSGSAICVLPFSIGINLGLDWNQSNLTLQLTGNLASYPARPVVLKATIGSFAPVRLAFAWTHSDNIPLILGQTNFFHEFEICFFGAKSAFEVRPKQAST